MRRLELLQDCKKVAFEILEAKVDNLGGRLASSALLIA
jgi:hypothetical protein